jgi:uncharacterized SAM-binding protein YcdF (DUF218 family)
MMLPMRIRATVTQSDVDALNTVAAFLALDDISSSDGALDVTGIDCIVWAGNAVLRTAEEAFRLVRDGTVPRVVLSGGIGHSTPLLWQAVAQHETYHVVATEGRSEARIMKDIAERFWNLDSSRILLDDASTNSGQNAAFSRRVLDENGPAPGAILLVQDPTMQRRADATFRHVWRDRPEVSFRNWPTFKPRVALVEDELRYDAEPVAGLWPMERFLSLVMGEIPRLRNDASGYGPRGKGFIAAVEIPDEVEAAYARLAQGLGRRFGDRVA